MRTIEINSPLPNDWVLYYFCRKCKKVSLILRYLSNHLVFDPLSINYCPFCGAEVAKDFESIEDLERKITEVLEKLRGVAIELSIKDV
jgi:hypothetical protein